MGVVVEPETLARIDKTLQEIKQGMIKMQGELDKRVAQADGHRQHLQQQITTNKEIADERNRAVWHQFNARRSIDIAIFSSIVLGAATIIGAILLLN